MYKIITSFLFQLCVLSALSAQETIYVKAQSGDATPRLQTAIEQARRLKGKKVVIQLEQGDYHCIVKVVPNKFTLFPILPPKKRIRTLPNISAFG